jgi:hypothetical protein
VLLPLVVGALMLYVEEARAAGCLVPPARRHPAVEAAREELRRRLNQRLALRDLASAAHVTPEHRGPASRPPATSGATCGPCWACAPGTSAGGGLGGPCGRGATPCWRRDS